MARSRKNRATASGRKWAAFENPRVAFIFSEYPEEIRMRLMHLRQLIFDTAEATEGVGELEETLRWGEPSYLTTKSRSGSIVRIGSKEPGHYAVYFHCQTDLVARFKELYPDELEYTGNRSITFRQEEDMPEAKLCHCISLALTYHLDKKGRARARSSSRRRTRAVERT